LDQRCAEAGVQDDSGRSWCFSTGAGERPEVDIFDWNRTQSRSDFSS